MEHSTDFILNVKVDTNYLLRVKSHRRTDMQKCIFKAGGGEGDSSSLLTLSFPHVDRVAMFFDLDNRLTVLMVHPPPEKEAANIYCYNAACG